MHKSENSQTVFLPAFLQNVWYLNGPRSLVTILSGIQMNLVFSIQMDTVLATQLPVMSDYQTYVNHLNKIMLLRWHSHLGTFNYQGSIS